MTPEQFEILIRLNNNQWPSELINQDFRFIFDRILSPLERDILLAKIEGTSNEQIAFQRKCKINTIQRITYNIKYKYRNGINKRLDDWKIIRENKHNDK